ncbi:MAG TPA: hypothetical protein VMV10_20680 [Pirellulales bacterium]|nr:hypothetical protein [Pirellulales bacterium]
MPLKLNVGLMKKIGQPRYGSLSASCHLEIELESSLLERDAEGLQDRIRRTFAECRRAVETELAIGDLRKPARKPATIEAAVETAPGEAMNPLAAERMAADRNGAHTPAALGGSQNGANAQPDEAELSPASASQLNYARRLASSIGRAAALRVEVLVQRSFGKPLGELSRAEAARLIGMLRAVKAGELDWETLLEEAAA